MEDTRAHDREKQLDLEFLELNDRVRQAGLYARTPLKHLLIILFTTLGLFASLFILAVSDSYLVQIPNAILAGLLTVQLGILGHDLSHNGVFTDPRRNKIYAMLIWGLGCGLSESRWFYKHNEHHKAPNHIGHDPDIDIPFIFEASQAKRYGTFYQRFIFPYQHLIFWPSLFLVYPFNILKSQQHLFKNLSLRSGIELFLMVTHFVATIGITFTILPFTMALIFNTVVFLTMSIYMGLIFAPNHKGETMLVASETFHWTDQIINSRNITASPLKSYLFGGLEYQIEHHLFPTMSRFRYHEASIIVKDYCQEHGLSYHETSWRTSLLLIYHSLRTEASSWR